MKPESVIEVVVAIALVVIIGFLVIAMMQAFLKDGGVIWNFIKNVLDSICQKAQTLIGSVVA